MGYAPDGSILSANDSVNGNWTYTYDDFNRVASANKTGQGFAYAYDRFGNRWQQNVTSGSGPNPSYNFNTSNRISSGVTYDIAGNVVNDGFHSYTYDGENRLWKVDGGASATYVYEASGQRVRRTLSSGDWEYLFSLGAAVTELVANTSTTNRSEAYFAGRHLATETQGTTFFTHSDWLGNERLRTNLSGGVVESFTSLSFGDGLSGGGTVSPLHFTGKDHDAESNLEHFWARQYSSTQGRWLAPDPAGVKAAHANDPQSWNRYAYVTDTPLSATDPTGQDADHIMQMEARTFSSSCISPDCTTNYVNGIEVPAIVAQSLMSMGVAVNCGIQCGQFLSGQKTVGSDNEIYAWTPGAQPTGCASGDAGFGNGAKYSCAAGPWTLKPTGEFVAANNGSWLQKGLDYLKNHPVFISVNEIVAGQITVQWSTKTVCANLGAGASVPPTKAVTLGVYNGGNMSNWTNVLSSWGYSFGSNLGLGYQMSTNSSGTIGGPTVSGVGLSGSYTYGGCMTVP